MSDDSLDRLERLAKLREQGSLSDEEFQAQKARIFVPSAPTTPTAPAIKAIAPPAKQKGYGLLALILSFGAGAFAVLLVVFTLSGGTLALPSQPGASASGAFSMCQDLVKRDLTAPATADFASSGDSTITDMGNRRYRVVSYVDAENGFGANIRTSYTCVVQGEQDTNNWRLIDLQTAP